jgi:hypothetical protein
MPVMDELSFERVKEAFHWGIVIAIARAAHRGPEAGGLDKLTIILGSILNTPIGMVDQAAARPLRRDGHRQGCQGQVGAQMVLHRPADNPAAIQVHDGGQIEPAPIGLDVGDVGEPDAVRRGSYEVPIQQVRGDRKLVPAVGGPHPPWPRHDGPDAVMAHQSLDAAAARPAALGLQFDMDARAAIASTGVAMDPLDVVDEFTIGGRASALRARAPGIIAGRRYFEHLAQHPHRIISAAIFDEAKSHFGTPAKIAIDFFKMSRSMRSRSFSRCKRAISAAWSADGRGACVVGRRDAAVGSRPAPRSSTQRRKTESRRPSSLATDPIERPLEATRSTACRL